MPTRPQFQAEPGVSCRRYRNSCTGPSRFASSCSEGASNFRLNCSHFAICRSTKIGFKRSAIGVHEFVVQPQMWLNLIQGHISAGHGLEIDEKPVLPVCQSLVRGRQNLLFRDVPFKSSVQAGSIKGNVREWFSPETQGEGRFSSFSPFRQDDCSRVRMCSAAGDVLRSIMLASNCLAF